MQSTDFYKLDRSAQERFIGSLTGKGLPVPIVSAISHPVAPRAYLGASAGCLVILVVLLVVGYGDVGSGLAIESPALLAVETVLAALVAFGVLRAAALRDEDRRYPFRRGLYVFPVGLIDARTPMFHVYPIDSLGAVSGPDARGLTLEFEGRSFSFPIRDAAVVENLKAEIQSARGAVGDARDSRESVRPKALAALDPLQGYANPLASSEPMKKTTPDWARFGWAIAIGIGVFVAGPAWMVRNARSDEAMFTAASAAGDTASLQAYLDKGKRHATEVSTILLPRALLKDVVKQGTVDAIEQFLKEHPTGAIATEARAALKVALLQELTDATKPGTLAALDEFAHRRDHALVDAELAAARHGVYQAAIARYQAVAPDKGGAPALQLVQRMVAWSEKNGPKVEVRFRTEKSKTLEKADRAAMQSRQWRGVVSLPSRYFDDAAEKGDRDALTAAVIKRFADVFPPEILALAPGAPLSDPDAPLPATVPVPTLFIEVGAVWAGSIQASTAPRGVFVGLDLTFDALFRTPDDPQHAVKVKVEGWKVPDLASAKEADKPEEVVYAAMRQKGFEQFQKKLLAALFK